MISKVFKLCSSMYTPSVSPPFSGSISSTSGNIPPTSASSVSSVSPMPAILASPVGGENFIWENVSPMQVVEPAVPLIPSSPVAMTNTPPLLGHLETPIPTWPDPLQTLRNTVRMAFNHSMQLNVQLHWIVNDLQTVTDVPTTELPENFSAQIQRLREFTEQFNRSVQTVFDSPNLG